jgi:hypothetical protein
MARSACNALVGHPGRVGGNPRESNVAARKHAYSSPVYSSGKDWRAFFRSTRSSAS